MIFELKKLFSLLLSSFSGNKIFLGSCFSSLRRRNLESLFCLTGINLSPYMFLFSILNIPLKLYEILTINSLLYFFEYWFLNLFNIIGEAFLFEE